MQGTRPIEARAFVRHAFGCFYKDFSKVDTLGHAFTPVYTFRRTMENFRDAVWAYGESIKLFKTHRRYTPLKQHVPEETLKQFPDLISQTCWVDCDCINERQSCFGMLTFLRGAG